VFGLSAARLGPQLPPCRCGHDRLAVLSSSSLALMLANGRGNLVGVEVVGSADLLPELVEILDDGVSALHDDGLAGSSSGVQMIGGASPSERQTASIVPRIAAFARCLQFHVSR
jgi:hypothetical protein